MMPPKADINIQLIIVSRPNADVSTAGRLYYRGSE